MRMERNKFIWELMPIIDRQLEIYKENPAAYVQSLPTRLHGHFIGRRRSKDISLAYTLACSLIATHRAPTAEYIYNLMTDHHEKDGGVWQPDTDPQLKHRVYEHPSDPAPQLARLNKKEILERLADEECTAYNVGKEIIEYIDKNSRERTNLVEIYDLLERLSGVLSEDTYRDLNVTLLPMPPPPRREGDEDSDEIPF